MGFNLSFLKDLNTEKKAASKAFGFLKKPVVGAARTVKNVAQYGPEVFATEAVPKTAKMATNLAVSSARGIARTPETIGRSLSQAVFDVGGKIDPSTAGLKADSAAPTDPVRRFLYGSEPIETYQKRTAGNKKVIEGSRFKSAATPISLLGAALTIGSDVTGNPLKKAGQETVEQGIKQLVKAGTEAEVRQIMKGTAPEFIDKVAGAIAKTKDPNIIRNILDSATPKAIPATSVQKAVSDIAPPSRPAAAVTKAEKGPQVISRSPTESPELIDSVKRGKLQKAGETAPIDSLKLGSDVEGGYDTAQVKKYVDDIKQGRTVDPIVIDNKGFVQDGKHRLEAMRQLGVKDVPVVQQIDKPKLQGAALQSNLAKKATQATPEVAARDPFDDVTDAVNGRISQATAANKKLLSQQRAQRFGASKAAGETAEGSQGYFKELSQLKGEYSKTKLGGMIEDLGPQKSEELFSGVRARIKAVPDSTYDELGYFPESARLNTQTAMRKVIFGEGGGVPTPSELKLIRVISPKLADDVASKIPKDRTFFDLVSNLVGIPRAIQASLDLSMGGRQGLLVAARHPVLWARANKASLKYLKSTKNLDEDMALIRRTQEYKLGEKYGLATPSASKGAEEAYASADIAKKIPVAGKAIEASQRAYDGGLTKLRSDLWKQSLKAYGGAEGAEATLGNKGMQDLAEAINTLTGRGGKKGGLIEKHVKTLSTTLFAPRLWAARLNTLNPQYYARLSPAARKVALENAGAFAAVASVALGAAVALGAKVETDPRSSDFLKIRFGDTRYDIFGGLQQNIVFAWRQITGEKKSTLTGDTTKFAKSLPDILTGKSNEEAGVKDGFGASTRLSVAADLATNKLAPVPAFTARLLEGKDRGGQEINPVAEIGKLFTPINLQGAYEAGKSTGSLAKGAALNIPNIFGIGTQTYGKKDIVITDKQKEYISKLETQGASKEKVAATKDFFQTLKTAPNRSKVSDAINKALESKDVPRARKIAQDYNKEYAKAFKKWADQYGDKYSDATLVKEYKKRKILLDADNIRQRLKSLNTAL